MVGEWVKGQVVGSGSFGTVHLAMNKSTGALFVVKSADSVLGRQCLEKEANILSSLNSPYIIQCLGKDISCEGRKLNLLMEYMAGGSLSDLAGKFGGALDENVIRVYTRQILEGLNYLHKNGIVHCDVKCKNVLLGSSGNIKLGDFGCAKRLLPTDSCTASGTPLWMAPEVLRNPQGGLEFASDVWSLGCTVIEMVTGRPPWGGDDGISLNPMAAVMKIACSNEIPEFPSQLSNEGLDFLAKCLERNPKKRWTTDELLNHPFVVVSKKNIHERASSPASILDVAIYEDESDSSCHENECLSSRIPFSTRCCGDRESVVAQRQQQVECDFLVSSQNWVTVRSN